MQWPIFAVALFVTAVLQITVPSVLPLTHELIRPDFLALLALFYALYAPRAHAPLAAWIIGFTADLLNLGPPPGTFAFAFGLMAIFSLRARRLLYPEHPVSRIILACGWAFLAHAFGFAVPVLLGHRALADLKPFLWTCLGIGLYTAAFTPIYYLWTYGKRWLGLPVTIRHV